MAQKIQTYTTKRSFEVHSTDRFVFSKMSRLYTEIPRTSIPIAIGINSESSFAIIFFSINRSISLILFIFLIGIFSCGEPEIKLNRADRKAIDTLTNNQLDSISPILDSLCIVEKEIFIKKAVDSIMKERHEQEERLRLNTEEN